MFSWEIDKLISDNHRIITREQFYSIVNKIDNPQIKDVLPLKAFKIVTEDGYDMNVIIDN
ncbi:MAG: hypothetical protein K5895_11875 [Lachnospiraceae bacterium]|nr:hypothetical protein [Lachnospiraceae bacterium]